MKNVFFVFAFMFSISLFSSHATENPEWIILDNGTLIDDGDYGGVWVCGTLCKYVEF